MYMLEKPFEMESLLTLIRHLLAFELTRFFLFPPPINKIAMEEARWGAVYLETHRLVLKIEGKICSLRRAFTSNHTITTEASKSPVSNVQFATKTLPKDFSACSEQGGPCLPVKSVLASAFIWRWGKIIALVEQNGKLT